MLINIALRDKNCKIKILSQAVFSTHTESFYEFERVLEREREGERGNVKDTYIRLSGIIFCPSLYHVTRGRGNEARGGWLMTAARP